MRKLSGSSYSLIVVMIVALFFIVLASELVHFASKLLPLVIGGIIFILAAIALIKEVKESYKLQNSDAANKKDEIENTREEMLGYLRIGGWIIGSALGIYLVGFIITTFVFVGLYMKFNGSRWYIALIYAVLFTGIMHVVFNIALKSDLYSGEIFKWLGF